MAEFGRKPFLTSCFSMRLATLSTGDCLMRRVRWVWEQSRWGRPISVNSQGVSWLKNGDSAQNGSEPSRLTCTLRPQCWPNARFAETTGEELRIWNAFGDSTALVSVLGDPVLSRLLFCARQSDSCIQGSKMAIRRESMRAS